MQANATAIKRLGQLVYDALGKGDGVFDVLDVGLNDRKLITTQTGSGIRIADDARQTLSHFLDHQVADIMAEVVVDVLEPVKVDKQNSDTALEAACGQQRLTQTIQEQGTVRKAGQNVMDRKVTHACFGLFTFGNVGIGRNITATRHRVVIDLNDAAIRTGTFHAIGFTTARNRNTVGNQRLNADIAIFSALPIIAQDIGKGRAFLDQIARQVQQFDIAFIPDHQVEVLIE